MTATHPLPTIETQATLLTEVNRLTPVTAPPQEQQSLADRIREALRVMPQSQPGDSKDAIRAMHLAARMRDLSAAQNWITTAWRLRGRYFANGADINPERIHPKIVPVRTTAEQDIYRLARYTWSLPYSRGYGRRLRFLILDAGHDDAVMGILGLQSPPIDFSLRDQRIVYPEGRKVEIVNQTMDIFTLGAVPPYNSLLAGKLVVYAAASQEIRRAYQERYQGTVTEINKAILPNHLVLLTTTSAFGRSSIYNRVRYRDRLIAQRLGYTTGYGNVRLNAFEPIYPDIKKFLIEQGYEHRMGFGKGGPKEVWRNITQVRNMLGIKDNALKHGIKREAWAIPLANNAWDYLAGQDQQPRYYDDTFEELADWWKSRWLLPRSERTAEWKHWQRDRLIESLKVCPDTK